MSQLGTTPMHAPVRARGLATHRSCLCRPRKLSTWLSRPERRDCMIRNAGSWDNAGTQQVTGQTVAAHIRRRVAIFVEPSPFSHVSGMKNRFECLIQGLRELGDDVTVVTPDVNPPKQYFGARIVNVLGFRMPYYKSPTLLLSLGLSIRVFWHLIMTRPDVIHVSSPGVMVFAGILYAKILDLPLVVSYHTHIPDYIPRYKLWKGLVAPMWLVIRFCTWISDVTLVTSQVMKLELAKNKCTPERLEVWQRGVDTVRFNPSYKCAAMRATLTDGHPEAPLLVHVGRLGAEKNLRALKTIMARLPSTTRLAFVGDGPEREALQEHFADMPNVKFMGQMSGDDLSAAYASGDVFMMPSESETLGFVALEAMASGLPVVAVAAGGLTDILTNPGVTGFLYPPGDYGEAARITAELLENAEQRQAVGAAARLEVERWGWLPATQQLREQQYQQAICRNRGRRWLPWLAIRSALAQTLRAFFLAILVSLHWITSPFSQKTPNSGDEHAEPSAQIR
ncbi:hypothetical protein ABBQ38_010407 [Trebouxia sp. C0009 RCD-2024]